MVRVILEEKSWWFRITMENSGVGERPENEVVLGLDDVPESCIARILSFTTPKDLCTLATVSQAFKRAANSDMAWQTMLPLNYRHILSEALHPIASPSMKELYFRLCDSVLTDAGTERVWLERSTGKICYMLSARDLHIVWGDDPRYWGWVSRDDSRFDQLAELLSVCWLQVRGRFDCKRLSPNTVYTVSFVLKFTDRYYGWNNVPVKFSLTTQYGDRQESARCLVERKRGRTDEDGGYVKAPLKHGNDGWMELVAGVFRVDEAVDEPTYVEFCMEEVHRLHWKSGILLDGIKIEPKWS